MTSFAFVFVLVPEPVWKMSSGKCSSSLPSDHFLRRLHDERAALGVEQAKIVIGLRGGPFQQAKRANKGPRKTPAAHRKIQDRALGRGAIEGGFRDGHFAHRILFDPSLADAHAVRGREFEPWLRGSRVAIARLRFLENGDEHRRNILQDNTPIRRDRKMWRAAGVRSSPGK